MNYYISDTHFYHTNIIKYASRPFKTVEEMNEKIIENWNKQIKKNDTIYHLGDVALCSKELLKEIINRLNGKICLIRGNHDNRSVATWEELGFTILRNPPIIDNKNKIMLSHIPQKDTLIPEGYINIHGHIHNKLLNGCYYHNENEIIEYPIEEYSPNKHFNISVENINYTPITIEEIKNKIKM